MNYAEAHEIQISREARAWADIKEAAKSKKVLVATAVGLEDITIKKGEKPIECLKLDYDGIYGYLPKAFIDNYNFKGMTFFLGKEFEFIVTSFDIEAHIFIANRIEALKSLSQRFFTRAKEHEIYSAFVRGVDPYNLYLLVDGIPVTLYRTEYSHTYVEDLREEVEIGDRIDVLLKKIAKPNQSYTEGGKEKIAGENGYLEVSAKELKPDPWQQVVNYKEKATYIGHITRIHPDYGIFVELVPGLTIRCNFPPNCPTTLKLGERVNVKITRIEQKERRITALIIVPRKAVGKNNTSFHRGYVR
ncbi:hypothetical protein [Aneurinibacillus tyrosinisolvens]|uniref:hypothetical protein n=1 Tax=Aneurinibacillus tyrosinisolvens TaxID=1443435 RepID=UPI00063EEA32|nr:hypothetical protein [Aneurinibacillus tyrosinisolvens]